MHQKELENIIYAYGQDLYSFCCSVTRNTQEAEDLYQDTFLKLYEMKDTLSVLKNPKSFLMSVSVNLYRNYKRKHSIRQKIVGSECSLEESIVDIHGLNPNQYSIMTMGGGYSEFVRDGIQYRMLEMGNIEMFADRRIYVGVTASDFYDSAAYIYDETSGDISRNPDYAGLNALFELPIDKSKGNPEAAKKYLESLQNSWDAPYEPVEMDETDLSEDEFMQKITAENIDEYAAPVESTRMVCPIDDEGVISYAYEFESGASGSGKDSVDFLFPDGVAGTSTIGGHSCSDGGLEKLNIYVFTLNEDGTVTFVIYQPVL